MDVLHLFREPVNAWSHCSGLLLAVPGTYWLWRRSRGQRVKQWSLLIFGLSLAFCYANSTLYHGVRTSEEGLAFFNLMDYIGIFVLIAGTYTPLACNLLRGRCRQVTLLAAWVTAAFGIALHVVCRTLPQSFSTGLYLLMGWAPIFAYFEIARNISHRPLRPLLWGGVLYTVGALINSLAWPSFWPGVFGAHELFHLFVVAGSLAHFVFMLTVVASCSSDAVEPSPAPSRRIPAYAIVLARSVQPYVDGLAPNSVRRWTDLQQS